MQLSWIVAVASILATAPQGWAQTRIDTHDNTTPAGSFRDGRLDLRLYAGLGSWRPESDNGPSVDVQAFGVEGGALLVPGPLVRVPIGTEISVTIRNTLDVAIELHGFGTRPMASDDAIAIGPGETRRVSFAAGAAGTYHYWATTTRATLTQRFGIDSQLSGAFVVDAPASLPDRVFVLTAWSAEPFLTASPKDPRYLYAINGRSWPHTTRLNHQVGDDVHWRIVNLTETTHPMHLHGFYFNVESISDGLRETPYSPDQYRQVVTEQLAVGGAARISWMAERDGNWLFHCHVMLHVSTDVTLQRGAVASHDHGGPDIGMRGLVVGLTVAPRAGRTATVASPPRAITLTMNTIPGRYGSESGYGFSLDTAGAVAPGPPLVLKKGEPVAITLKNRLPEATAIHWHGMELESYFDGVPGFSGSAGGISPPISAGGEFVARFTPPRAGTFMYHTHSHDERPLAKGLYGAMIVLEPDEPYDEATDHVLLMGWNGSDRGFANESDQVVLNGQLAPTIPMKAGVPNRLRIINITPNNDGLNVFLMNQLQVGSWTLAAKDGAERTGAQRALRPARQAIGVGEIYDFLYTPGRGPQWIEVRRGNGAFLIQAQITPR